MVQNARCKCYVLPDDPRYQLYQDFVFENLSSKLTEILLFNFVCNLAPWKFEPDLSISVNVTTRSKNTFPGNFNKVDAVVAKKRYSKFGLLVSFALQGMAC